MKRILTGSKTGETLLRAAGTLLDSSGIDGVTLRAVGARAGVSRQAPYKHFADKQQLLAALAAVYVEQLGQSVMRAGRGRPTSPLAQLRHMCRAYVRYALQYPYRYRLMFAADVNAEGDERLRTARHALGVQFVDAIAQCQQRGVLPGANPMPLAFALYAACHGVVELALTEHIKEGSAARDPAGVVDELLRLLANAVTAP